MEYKVVVVNERFEHDAIKELERQVKSLILNGWKPLGGVSLSISDYDTLHETALAQAMIKE